MNIKTEKPFRRGCKNGSIPCVKSGTVYYIDMEKLMEHRKEQPGESLRFVPFANL